MNRDDFPPDDRTDIDWDFERQIVLDTVYLKRVFCPRCGKWWDADISQEDIDDGTAKKAGLICGECLDGIIRDI